MRNNMSDYNLIFVGEDNILELEGSGDPFSFVAEIYNELKTDMPELLKSANAATMIAMIKDHSVIPRFPYSSFQGECYKVLMNDEWTIEVWEDGIYIDRWMVENGYGANEACELFA